MKISPACRGPSRGQACLAGADHEHVDVVVTLAVDPAESSAWWR